MIGDDGERLESRLGQSALLVGVLFQQPGEILGGAHRPLAGRLDEVHAAAGVLLFQLSEDRGDVRAFGQAFGDGRFVQRFGGGKEQRFGNTNALHLLTQIAFAKIRGGSNAELHVAQRGGEFARFGRERILEVGVALHALVVRHELEPGRCHFFLPVLH